MKRWGINRERCIKFGGMLLTVVEKDQPPSVSVRVHKMTMSVRPGADRTQRQEILDRKYREQLRPEVPKPIARWEQHLGVTIERFFVRRMKTRWGSCNPATSSIRLNTDLAKKSARCLEYIVVIPRPRARIRSDTRLLRNLA